MRRLFKKVPSLLPKSISQSSPRFCRWMRACRRDTLGDSSTIVLAAVRPSEQLPLIGWRVPSDASNQAPSSGGAFTRNILLRSDHRRKVSKITRNDCKQGAKLNSVVGVGPSSFSLPSYPSHVYFIK